MALTRELVLTIGGTPAPKGSMKCIGGRGKRHQLIEQVTRARPWMETITAALRRPDVRTWGQQADKGQPVGVEVTFLFHRPMSHYIAGDRTRLRTTAPALPALRTVGDVDKLSRCVLDALQDGPSPILPDDSQVCELVARKRWTDGPAAGDVGTWDHAEHTGIVVRIYPIT